MPIVVRRQQRLRRSSLWTQLCGTRIRNCFRSCARDGRGSISPTAAPGKRWAKRWRSPAGSTHGAQDTMPGLSGVRSRLSPTRRAALTTRRRRSPPRQSRARNFGADDYLGTALRVAGVVATEQAGVPILEEAVSVLERSHARLEHARALTDLGAALRRGNQRSEPASISRRDSSWRCAAARRHSSSERDRNSRLAVRGRAGC